MTKVETASATIRPQQIKCSVYVVQAEGGPVKIGIAIDPQKRLAALRTGTPFRLSLAYVEPVADRAVATIVERAAHALLWDAHAHGEWFNVTAEEAVVAVRKAVADSRAPALIASSAGHPAPVLTIGNQLKAARAFAEIGQFELARLSGLSIATIRNMEASGLTPIRNSRRSILSAQRALEAVGITFVVETDGDAPGVRLRPHA